MISYTTEIDLKTNEVRARFRKEVNTFAWDAQKFPLEEALKVSAELFARKQLPEFLAALCEKADQIEQEMATGSKE